MTRQQSKSYGAIPRHVMIEALEWPYGWFARYVRVTDPLWGLA